MDPTNPLSGVSGSTNAAARPFAWRAHNLFLKYLTGRANAKADINAGGLNAGVNASGSVNALAPPPRDLTSRVFPSPSTGPKTDLTDRVFPKPGPSATGFVNAFPDLQAEGTGRLATALGKTNAAANISAAGSLRRPRASGSVNASPSLGGSSPTPAPKPAAKPWTESTTPYDFSTFGPPGSAPEAPGASLLPTPRRGNIVPGRTAIRRPSTSIESKLRDTAYPMPVMQPAPEIEGGSRDLSTDFSMMSGGQGGNTPELDAGVLDAPAFTPSQRKNAWQKVFGFLPGI